MADEQIKERRESYHHGDLRGALIRATQQLIEEKGRDHFSVSDACRLAGVSTAAPYKHFKSKDEMVLGAVIDATERHYLVLQDDLAAHAKGSRERIMAMGKNYVDNALEEPGMFLLRFQNHGTEENEELSAKGSRVHALVEEEVRAALRQPEVNAMVKERSFMLWCFVHGLAHLLMVPTLAEKGPQVSLEQLLENVGDRILAP